MVEANAVLWDFIGDPRCADTSIITDQKRTGGTVHVYQEDRKRFYSLPEYRYDGVCVI
jgi:hypothetical protein